MSSLIEQAALRLQQLRQAGIDVPGDADGPVAATTAEAVQQAPLAAPAVVPSAAQAAAPHLRSTMPGSPSADSERGHVTSRLIELDLAKLGSMGMLTPNASRSALADQFRVIKRPLISNALGRGAATVKHGNLIMVTSALPGEGKTYTSVNLAMSIAAELDHTVMLVDADVARPSVLRTLGLSPSPGLLDLLENKVELAGALLRTNVDKLTILPSGTPHRRATELLASEAMSRLLDDMATRYPDRIIIFDSPPLLLTTESRVLATHMGQIVIVVHAERTSQADVKHALSTIDSCPVRMMVLNKASAGGPGAYGYGYGGYGAYGYGYGYGHDSAAEQGAAGPAAAPTAEPVARPA